MDSVLSLKNVLRAGDGAVVRAAREALEQMPLPQLSFTGAVARDNILQIYRRRLRLSERLGRVAGNFEETVSDLEASNAAAFAIHSFETAEGSFHVFVDAATNALVSVLRVARKDLATEI
jgi:hypothetical protein